jgi:hypothetical protein
VIKFLIKYLNFEMAVTATAKLSVSYCCNVMKLATVCLTLIKKNVSILFGI